MPIEQLIQLLLKLQAQGITSVRILGKIPEQDLCYPVKGAVLFDYNNEAYLTDQAVNELHKDYATILQSYMVN